MATRMHQDVWNTPESLDLPAQTLQLGQSAATELGASSRVACVPTMLKTCRPMPTKPSVGMNQDVAPKDVVHGLFYTLVA